MLTFLYFYEGVYFKQKNKHLLARWPVFPFKRHSSDGRVRLALLQGPRGRHLQAQLIRQFYGVRSLFVTFSFVVVPLFQIDGEGKMCQRTAEIEKIFQKNKQMTKSHITTALFTYTFTKCFINVKICELCPSGCLSVRLLLCVLEHLLFVQLFVCPFVPLCVQLPIIFELLYYLYYPKGEQRPA